MTRRERHMRILQSFGRDWVSRQVRGIPTAQIFEMMSDAGVEKLTRRIVSDWKYQQKLNRENRRRLAVGA